MRSRSSRPTRPGASSSSRRSPSLAVPAALSPRLYPGSLAIRRAVRAVGRSVPSDAEKEHHVALAGPATAHPLENFTVNHLTRITLDRDALQVRYVLDLAEIPAFTLDRSLDPHGTPSQAALDRWAAVHAREIAPQLDLNVDGRAVALVPAASTVRTRPGAGGQRLTYRDRTEAGRLGWKDVVTGTVHEPSDELRSYPNALIGSPRARTAIAARVDTAGRIVVDALPVEAADAAE